MRVEAVNRYSFVDKFRIDLFIENLIGKEFAVFGISWRFAYAVFPVPAAASTYSKMGLTILRLISCFSFPLPYWGLLVILG